MPVGSLGVEYFRSYGADPRATFVVPYEPDYTIIGSVSDAEVREYQNRKGLDPGRHAILFAGRLAASKRVDLAIHAFVSLAPQRPDWDLHIVGDGPLRAELARLVPLALSNRVRWFGFLEAEEMPQAYRAADLLVLPSDNEPWGLVVNEAMAAGLPVVVSDVVGAAADLVVDGVNGRIFRAGDVDALHECLDAMTRSDVLRAHSAEVSAALSKWRATHDPVNGVRSALSKVWPGWPP